MPLPFANGSSHSRMGQPPARPQRTPRGIHNAKRLRKCQDAFMNANWRTPGASRPPRVVHPRGHQSPFANGVSPQESAHEFVAGEDQVTSARSTAADSTRTKSLVPSAGVDNVCADRPCLTLPFCWYSPWGAGAGAFSVPALSTEKSIGFHCEARSSPRPSGWVWVLRQLTMADVLGPQP